MSGTGNGPSLPRVAVGALGGTIAMTSADGRAVAPTMTADDLAAAVPGLADIADLSAETLAMLPSGSLTESMVLAALAWARAAVADGAVGVVLTQGTDTLEESAYLLDLAWDLPEPLVVTGAMRSPQAPGADGPANLTAAVTCAAAEASRGRGVLVAFDDEIHLARWVAKAHSISTGAFRSPAFGPVGRVVEGVATYGVTVRHPAPLALPDPTTTVLPRVPLVSTHLGDDGALLDVLTRHGGVDGVVVAGFGAGHVSAAMAEAVGRAAEVMPVVFASRTGSGPTGRAMYGYPGSEVDLVARGAVAAGWLTPVKARLLLWALLAAGRRGDVADAFADRGQP
ncbi:asparaginase [Nocardioides sp. GY 10113]|uniref:asparaginase n=1 Tax=Nocardioides sp. GY 10113 TaxID=2569761 RepID=UPI0010A7B50C|nr:asparaginase [Nocardioides sp. GY 10113]TIC86327.1 asparaginase [Nocardioides sp. GY 10113]